MRQGVQTAGRWVLAYALWLLNSAAVGLIVPLTRAVILRLSGVFRTGPYMLGALDKFGLLFIAVLWLVWVLYTENRYRTAAGESGQALLRTARFTWLVVLIANGVLYVSLLLLR